MSAITVRDLVKSYGDVRAVDGISFEVPEGSFFAFLGPNGAGKSTTISIVCSLIRRDSGDVEILGKDPSDPDIGRLIGVVFQDPKLDKFLTVRENLEIRASMYGIEDVEKAAESAMEAAECGEFADRRYGTLSGGQRRRADIARAMVHDPRILILDEPTSGLDPHTRKVIWDSIYRLNKTRGMTVLLTTHYMEEASNADDVVVINHGRIVAHGTPEELKNAHSTDVMTVVPRDLGVAEELLRCNGTEYTVSRDVVSIKLRSTSEAVPLVVLLKDQIVSFEVRTGTLDDAFISITGDE